MDPTDRAQDSASSSGRCAVTVISIPGGGVEAKPYHNAPLVFGLTGWRRAPRQLSGVFSFLAIFLRNLPWRSWMVKQRNRDTCERTELPVIKTHKCDFTPQEPPTPSSLYGDCIEDCAITIPSSEPTSPAADKLPASSSGSPSTGTAVGFWEWFFEWFTMYRQLFALVLVANMVILLLAASGNMPWAYTNKSSVAVANVLVCILVRNEIFIRALYFVLVKSITIGTGNLGSLWAPVWLKNFITGLLLNIGGVHSGCGVGTLLWMVYTVAMIIINHNLIPATIAVLAWLLLVVVFVICLSATPKLRFHFHNHFEHTHRYAGWLSLLLTWAFLIVMDAYDGRTMRYAVMASTFYSKVQYFGAALATLLVALPWMCVRQVPVRAQVSPAGKSVLLKFPGYVQPGLYGRISRKGLSEWHVFGCFSEQEQKDHHYMLCSVVGDFTRELAAAPPTQLHVRTIKFAGYSYCHRMYNSGVAICTGAAIGVFISLFSQNLTNFSLIWVGSKFEESYGTTVMDTLRKGCPGDKLTLYDTSVYGRPNLVELASQAYYAQQAEVVFCVSNLAGTKSIVRGCRSRGIPAFGPIWDA